MRRNFPYITVAIIILNVIVFMGWNSGTNPRFFEDNFLVSWTALEEGRYWVLLTSAFSHNWLLHLFVNMSVLWSFGGILERVLGRRYFLGFYLLASVISGFAHAAVSAFVVGEPRLPALGASGAVAGVILVFSLIFPREKIALLGIIPMPAIFGALAFVALDLWGLYAQAHGGGLPIGHGAHLGGAFTGLVVYLISIRPKIRRWREQQAREEALERSALQQQSEVGEGGE